MNHLLYIDLDGNNFDNSTVFLCFQIHAQMTIHIDQTDILNGLWNTLKITIDGYQYNILNIYVISTH